MAKKEYIERGDIEKWLLTETASLDGEEDKKCVVERLRNDIPAADVVEVRHGWWMDSKEDGHPSICCVCNYPVDRFFKTKFCPNCGAKMTEDRHEQKE